MALSVPLVTGLFSVGEKLIDRLFPNPEDKLKATRELHKLEREGDLKEMSMAYDAITSEANSEDKWTSRARPFFMYVFYFILLNLVVVAPFVGVFFPEQMSLFFTNVALGFKAIPEELWWLFGTGYLGYTAARTTEKRLKLTSS